MALQLMEDLASLQTTQSYLQQQNSGKKTPDPYDSAGDYAIHRRIKDVIADERIIVTAAAGTARTTHKRLPRRGGGEPSSL